jgi:hypothetical protein
MFDSELSMVVIINDNDEVEGCKLQEKSMEEQ